jgi:Mrp family chromosome partitioning ATPase
MDSIETTLVMAGNVEDFHLADLIQTVAGSPQCTAVELRRPDGTVSGRIWIQAGRVIDAERGMERGRAAFFGLFATCEGDTFVVERLREPVAHTDALGPIGPLLLEAIEHNDPPEVEIEFELAAGSQLIAIPRRPTTIGGGGAVVAIASVRAGVGRTTVTAQLGNALARRGHLTLLIDAHNRGDLASATGTRQPLARPIDELLDDAFDEALVPAGHPDLMLLAVAAAPAGRPTSPATWRALLDRARLRADVVLIDCPPGMGGVAGDVIASCGHLIGVVRSDRGAPAAVTTLSHHVASLGLEGPRLTGMIVNQFDARSPTSVEAFQRVATCGSPLFETAIPRAGVVASGSAADAPIGWLFDSLAAEVAGRLHRLPV